MDEVHERTPEFATIEAIAGAIRRELGDQVEACPGGRTPEQAEPLNRAFRAVARRILEGGVAPAPNLAGLVTEVLHGIARRRLVGGGLDEGQIKGLLEFEPGTPDDWLAFLILIPWHEVLFWVDYDDPAPG
jgi:hypothetical protein